MMRRVSVTLPWMAAVLCGACSTDYWLGGTRGLDGGDGGGGGASANGGATASGGTGGDGGAFEPRPTDVVLDADIVLTGSATLAIPGGDAGPCRVVGNGYQIRSEGQWSGHLTIRGCTIRGLGSASRRAISLVVAERGSVTIQGSSFAESGAVHITNGGDSTTTFNDNVVESNSVVRLDPSADATIPAFFAAGASLAPKFFQGNRIERSSAFFQSPNWLVGGSADAESNLFVGLRAGMVFAASGLVVRGNYVHTLHFDGAGDESAASSAYGTVDTLAEHNVFRGGTWVFRGFGGELRYSAVLDTVYSAWIQQPFENSKVHHNLFLMCEPPPIDIQAGIFLVNDRAAGIEIYNNTLDAGGAAMRLSGAAVTIDEGCFLSSLRSNAFVGFPFERNDGGAGAIRPGILEGIVPPPSRLGYADYNLFYNPQAMDARNYAVSVQGRTVRVDPGFGAFDSSPGGAVDQQVDPGPLGLPGGCFPWSDDDIRMRRVPLSQILAALRGGYTPAAGSALLGAGDPADGPENPIGAIGDGTTPNDRFGTFGR